MYTRVRDEKPSETDRTKVRIDRCANAQWHIELYRDGWAVVWALKDVNIAH